MKQNGDARKVIDVSENNKKSKLKRPKTAPAHRSKAGLLDSSAASANFLPKPLIKKTTKLSIREIIGQEKGNDSKPESVFARLRKQTVQLLESKKRRYDHISFELQRRQAHMNKLDMEYNDLLKECKALGINAEKEKMNLTGKMRTVSCVSNKPIFGGQVDPKITKMEATLRKWEQQYETECKRSKMYRHMKQRYQAMLDSKRKQVQNLRNDFKELNHQVSDLKHKLVHVKGTLKTATENANKYKDELKNEMKLWKREIARKEKAILDQEQFAELQKRSMKSHESIQQKDQKLLSEEESKKVLQEATVAKMKRNITVATSSKTIQEKRAEEQKYIEVFINAGINVQEMTPSLVLQTCLAQSEIRDELTAKANSAQDQVYALQKELEKANEYLSNCLFASGGGQRTTNRAVRVKELELHELEKQLVAVKDRNQYLSKTLQPVLIGAKQLSRKLFPTPYKGSDIELLFDNMISKATLVKEYHRTKTRAKRRTLAGQQPSAAPTPTESIKGMPSSSPYNVRVLTEACEQPVTIPEDHSEEKTALDILLGDEEDPEEDRRAMKTASKLVVKKYEKRRRSQALKTTNFWS